MLIDVKSYGLAIPQNGAAALSAHVVPDDPLVILVVEALHRIVVIILPVLVEEVLVSEEFSTIVRRAVELATVIPGITSGLTLSDRRRRCISHRF